MDQRAHQRKEIDITEAQARGKTKGTYQGRPTASLSWFTKLPLLQTPIEDPLAPPYKYEGVRGG